MVDTASNDPASRHLTPSQWAVDGVVAAGAFGFACLQLVLAINLLIPDPMMRQAIGVHNFSPTPLAIGLMALTTLPLVARRRFPWVVLALTAIIWAVMQHEIGAVSVSLVGPLVALFTVAMLCPRNESIIAGIALLLLVVLAPLAGANRSLTLMTLMQNVALVAAVWFAGFALQTRQAYAQAAEERAQAAEMTRESLARERVEAERVRIAREVHDITAHSLSAVSIQAAAAERLIDTDPQAAAQSIKEARAVAKGALDDIRAMIGVLRDGEPRGREEDGPTRGTEAMDELVSYLRNAGVAVTLDRHQYDRNAVPTYIDVALYGLAREACTNIVRHAEASAASIILASDASYAYLRVQDDGVGGSVHNNFESSADASGHGLLGMQERVRLLNGVFYAGSWSDDHSSGFLVDATIPLGEAHG